MRCSVHVEIIMHAHAQAFCRACADNANACMLSMHATDHDRTWRGPQRFSSKSVRSESVFTRTAFRSSLPADLDPQVVPAPPAHRVDLPAFCAPGGLAVLLARLSNHHSFIPLSAAGAVSVPASSADFVSGIANRQVISHTL